MGGQPHPIDSQTLLREQAWLHALARSLVADVHSAEDVVQETWLAALAGLPAGRERPQIRAFLATVVRRVSGAWRRGEAQRKARERRASRSEGVAPESDAREWLALQHRLADAIAELREPFRTAIVMRYVEGIAPGEIARRLQETPEAVRTRLSRGLEMLRKRLDREFGGERDAWHAVLGGLVLRRGAETTALASVLAGAIMGWKSLVAATVLVLAVVGLWRWSREPRAVTGAPRLPDSGDEVLETAGVEAVHDADPPVVASTRTPAGQATEKGAALRGRVLALEESRPLVGARVTLQLDTPERRRETSRGYRELEAAIARGDDAEADVANALEARTFGLLDELSPSDLVTTTDAQGRFAFASVPAGDHALIASAEGYVPTLVGGASPARLEGREVEVTLAPAGLLEVDVVDEAGAPLGGIRLSVKAVQGLGSGAPHFDELGGGAGFGPSDGSGRVRVTDLPCGVELSVQSRFKTRGTPAASTTIDLEVRRGTVRLVVPTSQALTGIVHPAPAGGERVEARFRPGSEEAKPTTALVQPDGRFLLERLPAGRGELKIALIHLGSRAATRIGFEREVEVLPGEQTDLGVLELGTSVLLAGHVPDWGASSDDYFVELCFLRDAKTLARTTIDGNGRFEAWMSPGRCAVQVVHFDRVLGVVRAEAPDDDLTLDLLAFCAGLQGRLPESERKLPMLFAHLQAGDASDPSRRVAPRPLHGPLTVREGEFRTLLLAPGRCSLLAPFGERGTAWIPRIDLERGRVVNLGELVAGFGSLGGRVTDERGEPVVGAEVTLSSPFASVMPAFADHRATTSDDGKFEVQGLPAGPWMVTARRAGSIGSSGVADVFPHQQAKLDVVLHGSARLSVRVTRAGEPVANEAFTLARTGGLEQLERRTSAAGQVDFDGLAPDGWAWTLGAPVQRSGRIELRAGESRLLDIDQLRHPVRLRLAGSSAARGAVLEARAWSLDADRCGEMQRAEVLGEDWFELDLEPGRYVIAARASDERSSAQHLGVVSVAADVRELDFVPSKLALTIHIEPDERDSSPPTLSLVSLDGISVEGWSIPAPLSPIEGGWRCHSLPSGAGIRLSGATPNGSLEREVFVSPGAEIELDWH